jgi:hypothetical protein
MSPFIIVEGGKVWTSCWCKQDDDDGVMTAMTLLMTMTMSSFWMMMMCHPLTQLELKQLELRGVPIEGSNL